MKFSDKIVTAMPLESIWTSETQIKAKRTSYLTKDKLKELLKKGSFKFVVADVGLKLKWIDKSQCFDFWKSEVEKHLANDIDEIFLDNFPNNYAYIASKWEEEGQMPIVLLEKTH